MTFVIGMAAAAVHVFAFHFEKSFAKNFAKYFAKYFAKLT